MNEQITYQGAVYPWHCDHMGHMNVMWYVGKFDEATWQLFARLGITPKFMSDQQRAMVAVEQHIEYKRELMAGDIVTVRSTVVEIRDKVLRFSHVMTNSVTGEVAATTVLTAVHLDAVARKAASFPAEIRERAAAMIVP